MSQFGVGDAIWQQLFSVFKQYEDIDSVLLYGSRARGDEKQGSDIDLAIHAPKMNSRSFARLWNAIDELPIIYPIDVVHIEQLHNQNLLTAIKTEGVKIYP